MKNNFNELATVKLGKYGETLIENALKEIYIIYAPKNDGSHFCDLIAYQKKKNRFYFMDVKTQNELECKPVTGINSKEYKKYLELTEKHNTDFVLFFVDAGNKKIFMNSFSNLINKQTFILNGRTYWYIKDLKVLRALTDSEIADINELRALQS
jgi:hypothetical protein